MKEVLDVDEDGVDVIIDGVKEFALGIRAASLADGEGIVVRHGTTWFVFVDRLDLDGDCS